MFDYGINKVTVHHALDCWWQGVLEAIRISCAGYPTKRSFDEFLERFGMLSPDVLDGYTNSYTSLYFILY